MAGAQPVSFERISVRTRARDDWRDVTARVARVVERSACKDGVVHLFVPHTTAAITVQENADPPLKADINRVLDRLVPRQGDYQHCEDNAASHVKAALVGASLAIPFQGGKLLLGQWQAIYLCEFDGPRERQVVVSVVAAVSQ